MPQLILFAFLSTVFIVQCRAHISDEPIQPSLVADKRIINLGALPFGAKNAIPINQTVMIEDESLNQNKIDITRAHGVSIIDKRQLGNKVYYNFQIDPCAFVQGYPYGLLIEKPIRIITSDSQLVIKVVGWTSINKTKRNFNDYLFQNQMRWSGPFTTPNIAGAILVPLAMLTIGLAGIFWPRPAERGRMYRIVVSGLLIASFTALAVIISNTYSRGSWIAFFIAICLFGKRYTSLTNWMAIAAVSLAVMILVEPKGGVRLGTISNLGSDPSIYNRMALWLGALEIATEHPVFGIGTGKFGETFESDYQSVTYRDSTVTAVNDYFTLAAERGFLVYSFIVGGLISVLCMNPDTGNKRATTIIDLVKCSVLSMMVCSFFSSLYFVATYRWMFVGFITIIMLVSLISWYTARTLTTRLNEYFRRWSGYACVILLGTSILGELSLAFLSTISSEVIVGRTACHMFECRWHPSKGVIIYLADESENTSKANHYILRPLAEKGWKVVVPNEKCDERSVIRIIEASGDKATFLIARGSGAELAWTIAIREAPIRLVAISGYDFLTQSLYKQASRIRCPFLVYQSLYDYRTSAAAAIKAASSAGKEEKDLTVKIDSGESGYFGDATSNWIKATDDFFSAQIADSPESVISTRQKSLRR